MQRSLCFGDEQGGAMQDGLQSALAGLGRIWLRLEVFIVALAALAIVLVNLPGVDPVVESLGFAPGEFQTQVLIPLILVAIAVRLAELSNELRPAPIRQVFQTANDVYPLLAERIETVRRDADQSLQVIGMNLYTAWPAINQWVNAGRMDGWRISFAAFTDRSAANADYCNPQWASDARAQLGAIERKASRPEILNRGITLTAHEYSHLPVVHGFRLGTGDIFVSMLRWDPSGSWLTLSNYQYEYVSGDDTSSTAVMLRGLFDSWWSACSRTPFA